MYSLRKTLSPSIACWTCAGIYALWASALLAQQNPQAAELQRRLSLHTGIFAQHDRLGKPLTTMRPDANGVVTLKADFINDYVPDPSPQLLSSEEQASAELARFVRDNPVIVTARAVSHRSAFTPSKAFIYSDWDFEVSRIFKNESAEAAQLGSIITVTRPCGSLIQNGVKYVAEDKTFPEFQDSNVYILFLRPLTDGSHSFRVFSGSSFLVGGSSLSRIDDYQRDSMLSDRLHLASPETFATSIDNAVKAARR